MVNTKTKKKIAWVLLLLAIVVMVYAGWRIWAIQQVYAAANASYTALIGAVRTDTSTDEDNGTLTGSLVDIPQLGIDFAALQAINPDAVAWIYSPGTVIDYPVMAAADYGWYLTHLPDGTYNVNGTPFLDYNNPADFSGRLNIIYAHNMNSGKMFAELVEYKKQAYFDEHPYMYLYTSNTGNYRIDLLYGCVVDAGEWRDRAFMYEINLPSLLAYAAYNTTFTSPVEYTETDRFVVLSTCSYEFDDARYVVIGVLRPA